MALAATGGRGPLHWSVEGTLPEWLTPRRGTGRLAGTPPKETDEPLALAIQVSDGTATDTQPAQLLVLPFQAPLDRCQLVEAAFERGPAGGPGWNKVSGFWCSGSSTCWG